MRRFFIVMLLMLLNAFCIHTNAQESDTVYSMDDTTYAAEEEAEESGAAIKDTSRKYEHLYMNESKLNSFREQKDFQYRDIDSAYLASIKPQKETEAASSFKGFDASILLWLVGGITAIVLLLQLSNINVRQVFGSRKGRNQNKSAEDDNLHDLHYDNAVREAEASGKFSLATRYMYLRSLKLLAGKGLIKWHINKTNWQYVYEVKPEALKSSFKNITSIFEYALYGNMNIEEDKFRIIKTTFTEFDKQLI